MFAHRKIYKYTGPLLRETHIIRLMTFW
jgi:hypothetical protein